MTKREKLEYMTALKERLTVLPLKSMQLKRKIKNKWGGEGKSPRLLDVISPTY